MIALNIKDIPGVDHASPSRFRSDEESRKKLHTEIDSKEKSNRKLLDLQCLSSYISECCSLIRVFKLFYLLGIQRCRFGPQ